MLFNSYEFIFLFLPVTLILYFFLSKIKFLLASKAWLVFTSLFFYSWWDIVYLPLILGSILFNFTIGSAFSHKTIKNTTCKSCKKSILVFGIVTNLALLGYFKYTNFFISNINSLFNANILIPQIILPLGISFFTFTQIAYLVDTYKGEVKEMDYLNYTLFVTFFPHLLAGPILHHKEMIPQFNNKKSKLLNYKNLSTGLFLFSIGLFKKVGIADRFAEWANIGFENTEMLSFFEAWTTSLSYTFQLYFDFSGYTDMALGVALMFNIQLPVNFNSPYKALNIQDFWRRWHITLSRFLRDYIYIALGGNRNGKLRTYINLFTVFLIGGFWHGASWMFIIWGSMHGAAIVIHRYWNDNLKPFFKTIIGKSKDDLFGQYTNIVAWFITFNFINLTWIFFRAKDLTKATDIISGMFGFNGIVLSEKYFVKFSFLRSFVIDHPKLFAVSAVESNTIIYLLLGFIVVLMLQNSNEKTNCFRPSKINLFFMLSILIYSIFNLSTVSEFLYFNF